MAREMSNSDRNSILQAIESHEQAELQQLELRDPGWEKRVEERKKKVAIGQLKVEKDIVERDLIKGKIDKLKQDLKVVEDRIESKMSLNKRENDSCRYGSGCQTPMSLCDAVAAISEKVNVAELSKDPAGKQFLKISSDHRVMREKLALCSTREQFAELGLLGDKILTCNLPGSTKK